MSILDQLATPNGLKLDDPMEQMGNYLKSAALMEQIGEGRQKRQSANALNTAFRDATDKNGVTDRAKLRYLVSQTNGASLPDVDQGNAKLDEIAAQATSHTATGHKADTETLAKKREMSKQRLALIDRNDPSVGLQQFIAQMEEEYADPDIVRDITTRVGGNPEMVQKSKMRAISEAQQAAASGDPKKWGQWLYAASEGLDKALSRDIINSDLGGHRTSHSVDKLGNVTKLLDQQVTVDPNSALKAPKTVINNIPQKAVSKLGEGLAGVLTKEYETLRGAARTAKQSVAVIDHALDTLKKGNVLTGAGAETLLAARKWAATLGLNENDPTIKDTEGVKTAVAQVILSDIATMASSGVSLTPMSNHDRELLERASVMTSYDTSTIKELLRIKRRLIQGTVKTYNKTNQDYINNPETSGIMGALSAQRMDEIPYNINDFNPSDIAILKKDPSPDAQKDFDSHYGEGAAAQIIGGAPKGGRPFGVGR